jgi:hypothetical protein
VLFSSKIQVIEALRKSDRTFLVGQINFVLRLMPLWRMLVDLVIRLELVSLFSGDDHFSVPFAVRIL